MMTWDNCAVCLYFDAASETVLKSMSKAVSEAASDSWVPWRPHITLSGCDGVDVDGYRPVLEVFAANKRRFNVLFSSLGVFPAAHGTVFLSPVITPALLELNCEQELSLSGYAMSFSPYYQIGRWVPHCTLAFHVPPKQVSSAVAAAVQSGLPLSATVQEIAVVQVLPDKVQTVYSCALAAEETDNVHHI